MLIVDTGPLVAAADRTDPIHQSCARLLETDPGPLVTTPLVVAETVFLITRQLGPGAEVAFYDAIIDGELTVEDLTIDDSARVRVLVDRYQNMPLGGTDASVIAVAERHHVTRIATIDRRHFSVVRPAHCPAFELLPA